MKKFIQKTTFFQGAFLIAIVSVLVAWDMAFTETQTVMPGSFRVDSLLVGTPAPATTVAVIASDNKELKQPIAITSTSLSFSQVKDMVKNAIDKVGGIDKFVQAGDTVLFKPNIVGANRPTAVGENTDLRVVKALMQLVNEAYGNKCMIYIAEGSARSIKDFGGSLFGNTQYADTLLRKDPDLKGIQFELLDLNDEAANGVNCVHAPAKYALTYRQQGKYWVHKYLLSPTVKIINCSVLKMHEPGLTNALKNLFGIPAGYYYGFNKSSNNGEGDYELIHGKQYKPETNYKHWVDETIVDLFTVVDKVDLNVVDAILCVEGSKSTNKEMTNLVRYNSIVAGTDAVAVDYVCTKMIGSNPDDIEHISLSGKLGLGCNNPDKITIKGENISRYKHQFDRLSMHSRYGQGNRVWLVSPAFTYRSMATQYIPNEATINPSKGNKAWSAPIYFFDDRIDLNSYLNPQGNVVSYCFTNVYSPTAKSNVELWLNSEEDMIVYLNGKKVYSYSGSRPNSNLVTDKPLINLLAGENTLLVKVLQTTGCYDFSLNICEPRTKGNRIEGLKFFIKGYNTPADLL